MLLSGVGLLANASQHLLSLECDLRLLVGFLAARHKGLHTRQEGGAILFHKLRDLGHDVLYTLAGAHLKHRASAEALRFPCVLACPGNDVIEAVLFRAVQSADLNPISNKLLPW